MSESADDSELTGGGNTNRELTPLQIFFFKVGIVTAAIVAVLYASGYFLDAFLAREAERITVLKGGPSFWATVEYKLYRMADEPDLPPEKKQKIIDALHKLSVKYQPYIDALAGKDAVDAKAK